MTDTHLVPVQTFCIHHQIDVAFIDSLQAYGMIETVTIDDCTYIHEDRLHELEVLVQLHDDLDINLEGLDVVANLLNKIRSMQDELSNLKRRLEFYED